MRYAYRFLIPAALTLAAQASQSSPAPKTPPVSPAAKENLESQVARQTMKQVLTSVNDGWFGKSFEGVNAVDLQGTLSIAFTAQAANAKVSELGQGQVKGDLSKGGAINLKLKGTYFANTDYKTEVTGDFGNLLYTRVGNRGFLYSKDSNCYTTKVDPPPADAPLSFMGWFRQVVNDIEKVYVDGGTFKASLGKEEAKGDRSFQTVTFSAPTAPYDPKKREQSLDASLGFWKRGRLEVTFDKATKLPQRMSFSNDDQGVRTGMDFAYATGGKLQEVTITNQSRGLEGPGSVKLTYGGDGLFNHVSGELNGQRQRVSFDMNLAWVKGKKSSSITSVPPPGATKKGGDEMRTLLAVNLAGKIFNLQRSGLNLRANTVTITNK